MSRTAMVPRIAVNAVRKLKKRALARENPPWRRTPKSPISCGISWRMTARVVAIPRGILTRYEAPITRPSIKL